MSSASAATPSVPKNSLFDTPLTRSLAEAGRLTLRWIRKQPVASTLIVLALAIIAYFYGFRPGFGMGHARPVLPWLVDTWVPRHGYEHGWLYPFLAVILAALRLPQVAAHPTRPAPWGLALVLLGAIFYVAAVRTYQARIAIAGFPFLFLGGVAWLQGWKAARLLAFPIFLIYFFVPIPGMIQATNGLQIFATKSAYFIGKALGVDAALSGNDIYSIPIDKWKFNIAEGCSGMRSLQALTLIGAVYAHLTQKVLWKKLVLFAVSIPLAILGNCLRVASILLVAEYWDPDVAAKSYHEGSGFLFFLAVGLAGLGLVDWLLNRNRQARVVTRRVNVPPTEGPTPPSPTLAS